MRPLTLDAIAAATGGRQAGDGVITAVATDTRTLPPGALFVALRGENHDGHAYAGAAAARGAAALMVEREGHGVDLPAVLVPDTTRAYGDLAGYYRRLFDIPVVAITGSVGKTTTKEMVARVLECGYRVHKNAMNFNNEFGVPKTIFEMEERHTALVLEMGMRGAGEIARLAQIGGPTVGVVTGVGVSHIERLGSRRAIAAAKGELLASLPQDGAAILPATDPFFSDLRARFGGETITCAVDAPADVRASDVARHEQGWRFTVASPWGRTRLFLPSPGRFNVQNALFALAVAGRLGVPLDAAARALRDWTPPAMRLEVVTTPGGMTLLSDAYNAAPDSMIGALETLRDMPAPGRRIAALGEMRELGDFTAEAHCLVGQAAAATAPDALLLIGPLTDALAAAAREAGYPAAAIHRFPTTDAAAAALPALVQPGDVVLVKGSRALAMEALLTALGHEAAAHG